MATSTAVLQLVVMMSLTTTSLAVKGFRLRTVGVQRSRGYSPAHFTSVLGRIDQLTMLVNDLQWTIDEVQETVKKIDASVDPTVVSQF